MDASAPTQQPTFDLLALQAGDVVFIRPLAKGPLARIVQAVNVRGQGLLARLRRGAHGHPGGGIAQFSHVMLAMGQGLIIHADGKTVALEVVTDALDPATDRYEIYRHAGVSAELGEKIVKAGVRYMQKDYRFGTYFGNAPATDTTQFCSRLVAHAYRAAGMPLTELPDHRVLPLDLHHLCAGADWYNVTAATAGMALPPGADELLGEVEMPDGERLGLAELLGRADQRGLEIIRMNKRIRELMYKSHKDALHVEGLLGQYSVALFGLAKQMYAHPGMMDDAFADRVARVLSQVGTLLDLARLPDIDLLVGASLINMDTDGTNASPYVGLPAPTVVREMQTMREAIRIYTYLVMAEIGLFAILAHVVPGEAFARFAAVDRRYADQFYAALQPGMDLLPHRQVAEPFAWIDDERDRELSRRLFRNMLAALETIAIASRSGGAEAAAADA